MRFLKNIIILIFMIMIVASSRASNLVDVTDLFIEVEKMTLTNRQYYLPEGSTPTYNLNLGLNMVDKFSGLFYINNLVSSTTDQNQFRYIALDTEFGIDTTVGINVYFRHYSGHLMDAIDPSDLRFPEENVIGVRLNLIKK